MTRVLFIQDVLYEAFGPQLLSAVLKQRGHECDLLVIAAEGRKNVLARIRSYQPHLLAFSISSFGFRWALDIAREVKGEINVVTVFGGPHPTFFPEFAASEGVDYSCVGEGEDAMVELAEAVGQGLRPGDIGNFINRLPDGSVKRNALHPLIEDLDTLPPPDRSLHFKYAPLRMLSYKRFLVGRGCPYQCTYCFNKAAQEMYKSLGRYVRHRSPEHVVSEILEVKRNYGIKTVGFSDDTFTTNKKWLLQFLDLYQREVRLPFTCLTRVNEIDEEVAESLAKAGCTYTSFGVEVGNETIRNTVLNRKMTDKDIREKSVMLHRAGIKFLTFNMFGVPGETTADGLSTIRLNAEIKTDLIGTSIFQPLLGTEIFRFCKANGYLDESFNIEDFDRMTNRSPLQKMPDLRALENLQKMAFLGVHFPSLIPLLGRIARWPMRPVYSLLHNFSLFLRYKVRFGLTIWETLRLGMGARGRFG